MQLSKSGALLYHLISLLNQSSHWIFCITTCYVGLGVYWLKAQLHHSSSLTVFPQIWKLPSRPDWVFRYCWESFQWTNNIVFSFATDVILFLIFLQVILRKSTTHFSLTNLKKDETIFSAWIIAKSTWQSELLNSETAGVPRISVTFL